MLETEAVVLMEKQLDHWEEPQRFALSGNFGSWWYQCGEHALQWNHRKTFYENKTVHLFFDGSSVGSIGDQWAKNWRRTLGMCRF